MLKNSGMSVRKCVSFTKSKKQRPRINYNCLLTLQERVAVLKTKRQMNYIIVKKISSYKQWIKSIAQNPKGKAELKTCLGSFKHMNYYINKVFVKGELYWVYPITDSKDQMNFGHFRSNALKDLSGFLISKSTLNYLKSLGKKIIDQPSIEIIW